MAEQWDDNIEAQVAYYKGKISALTDVPLRLHLEGRLNIWRLKSYALLNAAGRGAASYSLDGRSFNMVGYEKLKIEQQELFDELQTYIGAIGTGSGTTFVDFSRGVGP